MKQSQKSSQHAGNRQAHSQEQAYSQEAHDELKGHQRHAKQNKIKGATNTGGRIDAWRFWCIWLLMVAGVAVLIGRAYYLQVIKSDYYKAKGESFITSKRSLPVSRGMILDRNDVPLAANAPLVTIVFSPYDYAQSYYNEQRLLKRTNNQAKQDKILNRLAKMDLRRLSEVTGYELEKLQSAVGIMPINAEDPDALARVLPKGKGSQRLVLLSRVTPEQAAKVHELAFVGVSEEVESRRFYLQAEPMAQLLGYMAYTDQDGAYKGRAGIEGQYEEKLAGEAGQVLVLKNADQYALKQIKEIKPAILGQNVHLTIDSRLQYVLYKELERVGREQSARWTSGIITDIQTGEVLAMGSWPSFNTNNLNERVGANERNRVLLDVFEPGSTMKPFTVAAALESGQYTTSSLIDTGGGSLRIPGGTIRDGGAYGVISLAQLIQKSSNVASAKIALSLPPDAIASMQQRFGFGQKTALNFPAEIAGKVAIPTEKEAARRATLAYGYGQEVNLAQIAQAYATLGAGGVRHPLRLIKDEPMADPVRVIDQKIADEIVAMMELVTMQGGTARQAAVEGYRVAGKTGTSRRTSPMGGYADGEYRTICAGIAPVSNPRFAVAILVEHPRRQFSAGVVSGPVFSRVMRETLRLYHVPMDKPLGDDTSASTLIPTAPTPID